METLKVFTENHLEFSISKLQILAVEFFFVCDWLDPWIRIWQIWRVDMEG